MQTNLIGRKILEEDGTQSEIVLIDRDADSVYIAITVNSYGVLSIVNVESLLLVMDD